MEMEHEYIYSAALEGLELKRAKVLEQIAEVRRMLGERDGDGAETTVTRSQSLTITGGVVKVPKRHTMSDEARKRIARAQRKRWAEWRRTQK